MTADPRARPRLAADPGRHGESPIESVAGDLLPLGIAGALVMPLVVRESVEKWINDAMASGIGVLRLDEPRKFRECPSCFGKGVGARLHGGGNAACSHCQGFGTVAL